MNIEIVIVLESGMHTYIMIALVIVLIFLINVVFGYWRANTRKLSLEWISAVHLPVPMAIGLRLWLLGWNWMLLPVFVADFAAGQYAGSRIRRSLEKSGGLRLTSWLPGDLWRKATLAAAKTETDSAD